jgi:hypothetical protein
MLFKGAAGWLAAVTLAVVTGIGGAASAATIVDFGSGHADPYAQDGFSFDPARIVNGNCLSSGGCLALNDNETTSVSYSLAPGSFTLGGLSFNLLGKGTDNALTITGSNGTSRTYGVADFAKNTYHSLVFGDEFANVSSVLFSTAGGGNVRIDDVALSPVPLPPAALLLLSGLGVVGFVRRRAPATA